MNVADVTGSSLKILNELVKVSTSTDYLIIFLIGSVWVAFYCFTYLLRGFNLNIFNFCFMFMIFGFFSAGVCWVIGYVISSVLHITIDDKY